MEGALYNYCWNSQDIAVQLSVYTAPYTIIGKKIGVTKFDILYDRGRLSSHASKSFNNYLVDSEGYFDFMGWKNYSGTINKVVDVDSLDNSGLWLADHVAGALHVMFKHDVNTWMELLRPKFIGRGFFELW